MFFSSVLKLSLACFSTLTPTFWCVVSSPRCYPGVFSSSEPLPFFLSYLTSLPLSSHWRRASVFHPLPQFLFHWLLLASCLWLPPHPLSLSLARSALPPFLVNSSSHSLSWLFLSPSLSFTYLQKLVIPQSARGVMEGDLIQCWCCVSMYVPSLGTDLITFVLPQYATITPRIL